VITVVSVSEAAYCLLLVKQWLASGVAAVSLVGGGKPKA